MTADEAATLFEQYRAGLDAEVALLKRLEVVAGRQHAVSVSGDLSEFAAVSEARDQLMAGLVSVEQELRAVRQRLADEPTVREQPGFESLVRLHRTAVALATKILDTDQESLDALAAAERSRREAARALEQGETTLAAYRRLAAVPPPATLVNRKG